MLDALTLDQLRILAAIADAGSFRAAATKLQRAQSAVSFGIANLETQLGVPLFDRTSRTASLTPAGATLLQDARAILLKTDALKARGRGLAHGIEIAITLAVELLYPPDRVAAALAGLRRELPSVSVQVLSTPLGGPIDALASGEASLAIVLSEQIADPLVELEWLGEVEFQAVAASSHPLAELSQHRTLTRDDLSDHLQIIIPDPSRRTDRLEFGVASPHTWRVSDLSLKLALLEHGLGWGHLPAHLAFPAVASGRLARLRPADTGVGGTSKVPAFLARRHDRPTGPAAALLRAALTSLETQGRAHERGASREAMAG